MPKSESKCSETDDDDDSFVTTPRVHDTVASFAQHCLSDRFARATEDFERRHCSKFENWDPDAEQDLTFTDLHRQYCELLESLMEDFLREEDVDSHELLEMLAQSADDKRLAEFLPQIILNTEYVHFAAQMKGLSNEQRDMEAAGRAAAEAADSGTNLSGVYYLDPDRPFDKKGFGEYVSYIGAPWVFRKLISTTAAQIRDVIVTHTDTHLTITHHMRFFGTKINNVALDGVVRESTTPWRVQLHQFAEFDEDRRACVVTTGTKDNPHPALGEGGKVEHVFLNKEPREDGRRRFSWQQHVFMPTKDLHHVAEMEFIEQASGSRK